MPKREVAVGLACVWLCVLGCEQGAPDAPPDEPPAAPPPPSAPRKRTAATEPAPVAEAPAAAAPEPAAPAVPEPPPPAPAPNTVLRPTFSTTTQGEVNAGTAFIVRWKSGQHLLLTAHHLFGPMGGMARDISAKELPAVVKSVRARSADDAEIAVESARLLSIPGAHAFGQQDLSRDLAAFLVDDPGKAGVLRLAAEAPRVGDRVYLLGDVIGERERLFPAKVVGVTPKLIAYVIDDSSLQLRGTSGAPVIDARGDVVGISLAGGPNSGELTAYANPTSAIRAALEGALAAAK